MATTVPYDESTDKGHRYGNFHNYYEFNPINRTCGIHMLTGILTNQAAERLRFLYDTPEGQDLKNNLLSSSQGPITALDVGCNEGDLTLSLYDWLTNSSAKEETDTPHVIGLGVDIDRKLIERANQRASSEPRYANSVSFFTLDVMSLVKESIPHTLPCPQSPCDKIRSTNENKDSPDAVDKSSQDLSTLSTNEKPTELRSIIDNAIATFKIKNGIKKFSLVTCFSVTMWIHINHGDRGLVDFLHYLSLLSDTIIIESQPWKCYRNAEKRLRRLGRPGHSLLDEPISDSREQRKLARDQQRRKRVKMTKEGEGEKKREKEEEGDGEEKEHDDVQGASTNQIEEGLQWRGAVEDKIGKVMCDWLGYTRSTFGVTAWDRIVTLYRK